MFIPVLIHRDVQLKRYSFCQSCERVSTENKHSVVLVIQTFPISLGYVSVISFTERGHDYTVVYLHTIFLHQLANFQLHNPKRFSSVAVAGDVGRLTLMFRFSLSGRSLQIRGLGQNLFLSLSLTHSLPIIIFYYHYYCTNQPAGRSFHFSNVVNRQTERNPCGKQ